MKKIFTLAAILAFAVSAFADDNTLTLYYDNNNGTDNNVLEAVENLQKITFSKGNVVLTLKDGTTTSTAMSDIKRMFFSTPGAVGIEGVQSDGITAQPGQVYDLTGRRINISMTSELKQGIYIIDGKKVMVK